MELGIFNRYILSYLLAPFTGHDCDGNPLFTQHSALRSETTVCDEVLQFAHF